MRLTVRLGVTLLVPMLLAIGGFGYANVQWRRREMLSEAQHESRDLGTVVAVALRAFLRHHELEEMHALVAELSRADRILGVVILDESGRVAASSSGAERHVPAFAGLLAQAAATRAPALASSATGSVPDVLAYAIPIVDAPRGIEGTALVLRDMGYVQTNLQDAARRVALAGAATLLLLLLAASWSLHTGVLRPLAQLLGGLDAVREGRLHIETPARRDDEIGALARSFNAMTRSLRSNREALDRAADEKLELLERVHHAQRLAIVGQFAANLGHRVGSPLGVILGRCDVALASPRNPERDTRHFSAIAEGAQSIRAVVETLLTQSRRGREAASRLDLTEVIRSTLSFLEHECGKHGITVHAALAPDAFVQAPRTEIEQVLLNLLLNAIHAQSRGGELRVTTTAVEGPVPSVEILVDDAGPGIPEDMLPHVFEPFVTGKPPGSGTGLGLTICNEIVHSLGGDIDASRGPLGGARFRVRLPGAAREAV